MATYDQQLRGRVTPVAAIVGMVLGFSGFVMLIAVCSPLLTWISWLVSGQPLAWEEFRRRAQAFEIPQGMWVAHLTLALLIVLVLALFRWLWHTDSADACSVQPGLRWRYLVIVAGLTLPLMGLVAYLTMSTRGPLSPQEGFWAFLVVILATSAFQAAGEEFFFRGLLLVGLGSVMRTPAAIIGSALVFAALHGAQSLPLFVDRFAFGIFAGALVVLTGGLEATIAIHAVNNILAFTGAGLWSTIATARATTSITWMQAGIDVAVFTALSALAWWVSKRLRVATVVRASDLPDSVAVR